MRGYLKGVLNLYPERLHGKTEQSLEIIATGEALRRTEMGVELGPFAKYAPAPVQQEEDMVVEAGIAAANAFKAPQKRFPWTPEEVDALEAGMKKYGANWVQIQATYPVLMARGQVSLKDKARNEKRRRMRLGIDPDIFALASS
jgi:hypothetical protein